VTSLMILVGSVMVWTGTRILENGNRNPAGIKSVKQARPGILAGKRAGSSSELAMLG